MYITPLYERTARIVSISAKIGVDVVADFGAFKPACVKAPLMMPPAPATSAAGGHAAEMPAANPEMMLTGKIRFVGGG